MVQFLQRFKFEFSHQIKFNGSHFLSWSGSQTYIIQVESTDVTQVIITPANMDAIFDDVVVEACGDDVDIEAGSAALATDDDDEQPVVTDEGELAEVS